MARMNDLTIITKMSFLASQAYIVTHYCYRLLLTVCLTDALTRPHLRQICNASFGLIDGRGLRSKMMLIEMALQIWKLILLSLFRNKWLNHKFIIHVCCRWRWSHQLVCHFPVSVLCTRCREQLHDHRHSVFSVVGLLQRIISHYSALIMPGFVLAFGTCRSAATLFI